jgi:hypothetical protein
VSQCGKTARYLPTQKLARFDCDTFCDTLAKTHNGHIREAKIAFSPLKSMVFTLFKQPKETRRKRQKRNFKSCASAISPLRPPLQSPPHPARISPPAQARRICPNPRARFF